MLIPDELVAIHEAREYVDYMVSHTSDAQSLKDLSDYFDKWHLKHRRQLHTLYEDDPNKDTHANFITWARSRFGIWACNQEKKNLESEIDEMTALPES
jgi:hypothetical protein